MNKQDLLDSIEKKNIKAFDGLNFMYWLDDNSCIKVYNKSGTVVYNVSVYADKEKYGNEYNNNLKLNKDYELNRVMLIKRGEVDESLTNSLYDKEFTNIDVFLAFQLNNKKISDLIEKIDKDGDMLIEIKEWG